MNDTTPSPEQTRQGRKNPPDSSAGSVKRTQQPGAYQDCAEYLVYDPRDDLDEIADALYPGLQSFVHRALN